MEDRGVSVTHVLRGRPCLDKNGVFGVWCPPLTSYLDYFCRIRFSIGLPFQRCHARPRGTSPSPTSVLSRAPPWPPQTLRTRISESASDSEQSSPVFSKKSSGPIFDLAKKMLGEYQG